MKIFLLKGSVIYLPFNSVRVHHMLNNSGCSQLVNLLRESVLFRCVFINSLLWHCLFIVNYKWCWAIFKVFINFYVTFSFLVQYSDFISYKILYVKLTLNHYIHPYMYIYLYIMCFKKPKSLLLVYFSVQSSASLPSVSLKESC